jgi:ankyrin repeat protein
MMLLYLPNELILDIAATIETDRDLLALAKANHRLFFVLHKHRYTRNVEKYGNATLCWAITRRLHETIRGTLAAGAALQNGPCASSPLELAAQCNFEDLAEILVGLPGVNINVNTHVGGGRPALCWAAAHRNEAFLRALLDIEETDVNVTDVYDMTPLAISMAARHTAAVRLLREHGACMPGELYPKDGAVCVDSGA